MKNKLFTNDKPGISIDYVDPHEVLKMPPSIVKEAIENIQEKQEFKKLFEPVTVKPLKGGGVEVTQSFESNE